MPARPVLVVPSIDEPRFGLGHALGVALLLHLLVAAGVPALTRLPQPAPETPPMVFTLVDVPETPLEGEPPPDALVSDRDRRESGDVPRVTNPDGREPPASGNTRNRILAAPEPVEPRPAPVAPPLAQAPALPQTSAAPPAAAPPAATPPAAPRQPSSSAARPDPSRGTKRQKFAEALEELNARLPIDMRAQAPPAGASPEPPGSGQQTRWSFDNPNPAFPVRVGSLSFDTKGADFGPWLKEFHARVLREWEENLDTWRQEVWDAIVGTRFASDPEKYNRYAWQMNNTRGVTGVEFVVTREGSIVDFVLVSPSGITGLDRSVHQTLRNVLLPPLPDDYPDARLPIRAGFYYNVDPPER